MNTKKTITVTKPSLPSLDEYIPYLESIWESAWLTNNGQFHRELEEKLAQFLGVKYISLCSNGTLALMLALKALGIKGEVITTPFSFVATSHAISWLSCTPVFVDVDPLTCNLDPDKIEAAITEKTSAIMPVHVYGNPCDNDKIDRLAKKYDLKVIYDAAHAFNVKKDGSSILNWGDISVLSFHATKVFNTIEGGAVICHSEEMKKKIDDLKNFGFRNETTVADIGINAKMNEVQAAMGLIQLKHVDDYINKRKKIVKWYDIGLKDIPGLDPVKITGNVESNYAYYPVMVDPAEFGLNRDELYEMLKSKNIYARRYFYPLISDFPMYKDLASLQANDLLVAENIAERVICFPIYPDLEKADVDLILRLLKEK